ncbi:MAG: DUF2791 family P-loop domain-containing protein [Anaerolineae bacterium]|nr:DUF2791 family P-loop domain-containing protein [Anaerolineae bacterium]
MRVQWEQMEPPARGRALNIVNRLREGVPPQEDVFLFSIGRDELLDYFERVLGDISAFGQQGTKFIQADYGHGKTHFLDMLAQLALDHNFVVSIVTLDREKAPFNKLEMVVPLIMGGIMTRSARQNALGRLLQQWAEKVRDLDSNAILRQIDEDEGLQLLFPDFRLKLVEYARAHNRQGGPCFEDCLQIEKWFRGVETKSKTFRNIPAYLAAFVQFIRHLGYSGFVVMLDEAESITLLSRITNRDQANENLRQIIDNQDLDGFYFVFASTPSFLSGEDDRGAQTYPALWRRISDPLRPIGQRALDKVIVELPALSAEEFFGLARRIKTIYQIAYDRDMPELTDQHLQRVAQYVKVRTDKSVRTLVRSTVMLLDELRNDQSLDIVSNYELFVERVIQDEERRLAL